MAYILTVIASAIAIIAYLIYYFDLKKSRIIPNRLSWIVWSMAISLETLTYGAVSDDAIKSYYFVVSSLCCIMITISIWSVSDWNSSGRAKKSTLAFYSLSFIVWPLIQMPLITHLVLLIAIPVTFIPTFKSSIKNYRNENSAAWFLWSISDLIIIITICMRLKTFEELPYAIVEFLCHFTVFAIILVKHTRQSKNLISRKFNIAKWYIQKNLWLAFFSLREHVKQ